MKLMLLIISILVAEINCDQECLEGREGKCLRNLCETVSCPGVPNAVCHANRCKCEVTFRDIHGHELTRRQCFPACPHDKEPAYCYARPCTIHTCRGVPGAICKDDYCGGCYAVFTDRISGRVLSNEECRYDECPPDRPLMKWCVFRPCSIKKCPAVPNAWCTDDFCGGCNAVFRDENGNVLSESACRSYDQSACSSPVNFYHIPIYLIPTQHVSPSTVIARCDNGYSHGSNCQATCPAGQHIIRDGSVISLTIVCLRSGGYSSSYWSPNSFHNVRCSGNV